MRPSAGRPLIPAHTIFVHTFTMLRLVAASMLATASSTLVDGESTDAACFVPPPMVFAASSYSTHRARLPNAITICQQSKQRHKQVQYNNTRLLLSLLTVGTDKKKWGSREKYCL